MEAPMPFWNGMWWGPGWFPLVPFALMILCMVIMGAVMMAMMGIGPFRRNSRESALDILGERFASGEIDRSEYEEKRRAIIG
jgi:putative membrane protein